MIATVLGGRGFIGRHLCLELERRGFRVEVPERDDKTLLSRSLGHVFYCIGLTADFRQKPFETIEAHASIVSEVLKGGNFRSFLYLSSTRIYKTSSSSGEYDSVSVNPSNVSDIYNISKLLGEAACLSSDRSNIKVARLSNVVGIDPGSPNFLQVLVSEALAGHVHLQSALSSEKDYISICDVAKLLAEISSKGDDRIYNVASGRNVSNSEMIHFLREETGCTFSVADSAPELKFPLIDVSRIKNEFGFEPEPIMFELRRMIDEMRACGAGAAR